MQPEVRQEDCPKATKMENFIHTKVSVPKLKLHQLDSNIEDLCYTQGGPLHRTKVPRRFSQCGGGKIYYIVVLIWNRVKSIKAINPVSLHTK